MEVKPAVAKLLGDERVRFLLIGGVNTVLGYGIFVLFDVTIGKYVGYLGSLYLSYVIATSIAFILHRRFTFRVVGTGNTVIDLLRFSSVYIVSLAINTIALPVLVEAAGLAPIAAQAIIVVLTTVLSYFGHKFFSFRRGRTDPDVMQAESVPPSALSDQSGQ
jgi:putative flippase GtrA